MSDPNTPRYPNPNILGYPAWVYSCLAAFRTLTDFGFNNEHVWFRCVAVPEVAGGSDYDTHVCVTLEKAGVKPPFDDEQPRFVYSAGRVSELGASHTVLIEVLNQAIASWNDPEQRETWIYLNVVLSSGFDVEGFRRELQEKGLLGPPHQPW